MPDLLEKSKEASICGRMWAKRTGRDDYCISFPSFFFPPKTKEEIFCLSLNTRLNFYEIIHFVFLLLLWNVHKISSLLIKLQDLVTGKCCHQRRAKD